MRVVRRSAQGLLLASAFALPVASCFIDNPHEVAGTAGAAGDAGANDAMASGDAQTVCDRVHGYDVVQKMAYDVVAKVTADCAISGFFTVLTDEAQKHLGDCLTKQLAVITHCPNIRYDVDNSGVDCRDMKTAHHGLAIRHDDFKRFVDDMEKVLKADGMSDDDWESIEYSLNFTESSVATNSAPDFSKNACDAGDAGNAGDAGP
jgi:hypothetical protein